MKTTQFLKPITIVTLAVAFSLTSCDRDEPVNPGTSTNRTFTQGEGFFVLNEGGFTAGNSSISYYQMNGANAGSSFNNLFALSNGIPLGDVAQSMTMINGSMYTVVNNSGKISVVNPFNMLSIATITGLAGPRYIMQVNSTTALVTQMYTDQIAIVNLSDNTVSGYITLGVTSEAIISIAGKIFVTSQESDKLYVLNDATSSTTIDSSMTIAPGGNSMVIDANGKLWVLAYGYWATSAPGGLFRIDPTSLTVEASMPMTTLDFATHLTKNPAGDSLFYLNFNIYAMATSDAVLPTNAYISGVGHAFYTIGMMPNTNNFFAGDAVDYVQSGLLFRYDGTTQVDVDTVGVIPNNFLWY